MYGRSLAGIVETVQEDFIPRLNKAVQTIAILFMVLNSGTYRWSLVLFLVFRVIIGLVSPGLQSDAVRRSFGVVYYSPLPFLFSLRLLVSASSLFAVSIYCFFFKRRLITAAASTIDSMKRIITNDYHFPSCCVIGGERLRSISKTGNSCFHFPGEIL